MRGQRSDPFRDSWMLHLRRKVLLVQFVSAAVAMAKPMKDILTLEKIWTSYGLPLNTPKHVL